MKRLMMAAVALVALTASSASAADLPVRKAPAMPGPAAFNWSGFYIGGHAGWISTTSSITDEAYYDSGATTDLSAHGFAGGGQIGFNLQSGSAVYGIEADASWVNAKHSHLGYYALHSTKWNAVGTIRGRLGVAFDRTLVYATAGGAWADVKTTYNTDIPSGSEDGNVTGKGRWGWTAGLGVEHAFAGPWSVKLEALYVRLLDDDSKALQNTTCSTSSGPSRPCTFKFDHEAWTVRLGLNYRFGGGPASAY